MISQKGVTFLNEKINKLGYFDLLDDLYAMEVFQKKEECLKHLSELKYIILPSSEKQDEFIDIMHKAGEALGCDFDLPKSDITDGIIYCYDKKWSVIPSEKLQEARYNFFHSVHTEECFTLTKLIDLKDYLRKHYVSMP